MLSEEFKAFIQSAIDEEARQEQEKRAQQEDAVRVYEADVQWFTEHVIPALSDAVQSVQALLPKEKLFKLTMTPQKGPTASLHFVRIGPLAYMREVIVGITSFSVVVNPGRSTGTPWPDKSPAARNVPRADFSAKWMTTTVEKFVEHCMQSSR
jgi:hypothetical protein